MVSENYTINRMDIVELKESQKTNVDEFITGMMINEEEYNIFDTSNNVLNKNNIIYNQNNYGLSEKNYIAKLIQTSIVLSPNNNSTNIIDMQFNT